MGGGFSGGWGGVGSLLLRVVFIRINARLCHEEGGGVLMWWEAAIA